MMQIFQYPRTIFIVLIVSFLIFNSSIYSIPEYDKATNLNIMEGKRVWQDNNCHTCHQLFGLGGYLGPDLTNVVAKKGYTKEYIKAVIKNGMFQMPKFELNDAELDNLLTFLEAANNSGSAQPIDYETTLYGTFNEK